MKQAILISAIVAAAFVPQGAMAHCGATQAGSASVSCERGVLVVRAYQGPLPSVSAAQSARMSLQRQQLAAQRETLRQQATIEARRLALETERVRNEGYLYRDTNSPLRQRSRPYGYGTRGYYRTNTVIVTPRR